MKRRLLLLLVTMFVTTVSWADVAINETNFPDATFRNWILEQDYGSDGILTDAEIASVLSIYVSGTYIYRTNISSLKGIEFFTALKMLSCNYCQLTSLDLSGCTTLTRLECTNNRPLTSLDVSGCTALEMLQCNNDQLTSLNASGCTALAAILCYSNKLTSLDVSGCTALERLDCYGNQIKGVEMDALIASLPTISNGSMNVIYNTNEQNQMTTAQVTAVKAKGWTPRYHNGSTWQEYAGSEPVAGTVAINETNFPDANFRNWLLAQNYGSDGNLTKEETDTITRIDVSNKSIKNLQGIEFFTALTELTCYNNQLTSLDVSKNTKLIQLHCGSNQLTALDVSKISMLQYLYCHDNQLTALDVSKNTWLKYLWCYDNQLTSLDVSKNTMLIELNCSNNQLTSLNVKNTALTRFYCNNNQLTSLDVSGCTQLIEMYIYCNQIKAVAMGALVESMPESHIGTLYVIYNVNEGNVMRTTHKAAANAKGWFVGRHSDIGNWVEYNGSEPDPGEKCATPTISIVEGKLHFSCETEGVEYVSHVEMPSTFDGNSEDIDFPNIKITVYATKEGLEKSDVAEKEINLSGMSMGGIRGDVNEDGEVNVGDIVVISNIMSGNE